MLNCLHHDDAMHAKNPSMRRFHRGGFYSQTDRCFALLFVLVIKNGKHTQRRKRIDGGVNTGLKISKLLK